MRKLCLVAVLIFVLAVPVNSAFAIRDLSIYLGLGTLSHGLFEVSQDPTSGSGLLGTFYFPMVAQTSFNLGSGIHLAPALSYTVFGTLIFPREAPDGGSKTSYFTVMLPVVFTPDESDVGFDWEAGPMFMMYSVIGSGGQVSLNNGSGFSQFGLPGNSRSAETWALFIGSGYNVDDFRVDLDLISEGLLTSRRTFSLMLTMTYNLLPTSYGGGSPF